LFGIQPFLDVVDYPPPTSGAAVSVFELPPLTVDILLSSSSLLKIWPEVFLFLPISKGCLAVVYSDFFPLSRTGLYALIFYSPFRYPILTPFFSPSLCVFLFDL